MHELDKRQAFIDQMRDEYHSLKHQRDKLLDRIERDETKARALGQEIGELLLELRKLEEDEGAS